MLWNILLILIKGNKASNTEWKRNCINRNEKPGLSRNYFDILGCDEFDWKCSSAELIGKVRIKYIQICMTNEAELM